MYRISKEFHFSAGHVLYGLPEGHKCGRPHGHNYVVTLFLESEKLDETAFVLDYGELSPFKEYIDNELDHQNLNEVLDFQTSAENLAYHFYKKAKSMFKGFTVSKVRVQETPKTMAEYYE